MARILGHLGPALVAALLAGSPARAFAADIEPILLGDDDRILVLAPHPSDETLAAGGLIQEATALELPIRVCFFTMGDNNEIAALFTRRHPVLRPGTARSSGLRRQNEAIAAATQLGLSTNDVVFLGYPDPGALEIWNHHWRTVPPYRSPLTRANVVPYDDALTPGSAHAGEDILDDLEEVLRDFRPTHVLLPHPADHNVDHRALYLFARVALWNLDADGLAPRQLAYPAHFTQWPLPRSYDPARPAVPPPFLEAGADWMEYVLAPFQVSNKLAVLRRHHSQFLNASAYLPPFVRKSEVFAELPDFAFPGGVGSAEVEEPDDTLFRPDRELLRNLAQEDESWNDVAGQNDAETAALGGLVNDFVRRSLSGDGAALTLAFRFAKPVAPETTLSVRLFGYRADVPFGEMPKIEIEVGPRETLVVRDLNGKKSEESIALVPGAGDERILRVPYALLGQPEKILAGAKLVKGTLPIDAVPWCAIDFSGAPLPDAPIPAPEIRIAEESGELLPAEPVPPAAVEPPPAAVPEAPVMLAPRVNLPRRAIPEKTEANEPVLW